MDIVNIVLGGLGGQGILFMTKILAQAALEKGFGVLGAETHGMAQRGGSVVSHLRIGEVKSSLVRFGSARFLLALEENEGYRNLPYLARKGSLYVNSPSESFPREEVRPFLEEMEIASRNFPASRVAAELGAPLSANLALLGFFSSFERDPFSYQELRETILRVSPERFREVNLQVFDAGYEGGGLRKEKGRPYGREI